ncbi:transposase family protein [Streptomyces adustus]|uniref:transposase family protein n=1 Tax=Streptomyces adustus TaxID=1609272 RepID=UPI00371A35D0
MRVERVWVAGCVVRIAACTGEAAVACPDCGRDSARVHSRYGRTLADVAVGGRPVLIGLSVRRLFCDGPGCRRRAFAGQVLRVRITTARRERTMLSVGRLSQSGAVHPASCPRVVSREPPAPAPGAWPPHTVSRRARDGLSTVSAREADTQIPLPRVGAEAGLPRRVGEDASRRRTSRISTLSR